MKKSVKVEKTICILINRQGMIYYSNIDMANAKGYLEAIRILDCLFTENSVSYNAGYYNVTADKVVLNGADYYLILIHQQKSLYKYAYRDLMTGLYNRNYWEYLVLNKLYCPVKKRFSLIIIDVDNLKYLNDNKGHMVGDIAIKIVGQAIKQSIRNQDIGIRYGGDEFLILLASTDETVAKKVINRIRKRINKKCKDENIQIQISTGIGCCDSIDNMEDIIKMADRELYKEKKIKKSRETKNSEKVKKMFSEIEKIRDDLNKITQKSEGINNRETLKLKYKLDKLLDKYLLDEG